MSISAASNHTRSCRRCVIAPRVRKWLNDDVLGIWSRSRTGRHLVVLVAEAGPGDDFEYWILGAREMFLAERKWFDNLMGGVR